MSTDTDPQARITALADEGRAAIDAAADTAATLGWTPWADAAEGFAQETELQGTGLQETGPGRPPAIPGPTLPLGLRRSP